MILKIFNFHIYLAISSYEPVLPVAEFCPINILYEKTHYAAGPNLTNLLGTFIYLFIYSFLFFSAADGT
jgi:hypothetical protein